MTIEDEYKPKVEGQEDENVEKMKQVRRVTALDCELSKDPLDENQVGYQKPEPKEERVQLPPRKRDVNRGGGNAKGKKQFNKDDNNEKDTAEKGGQKAKQSEKDGSNKHKGAHGKNKKRYNFDDNTKEDEQKGKPKEFEKEKIHKGDKRDEKQATPDNSAANKDAGAAPYGGDRGRRGKFGVRGGAGFAQGRGRGTRGGFQKRFNDDFDIQPSKRPRDQLDNRPHQSRDPRNSNNMKDHPQRGPID